MPVEELHFRIFSECTADLQQTSSCPTGCVPKCVVVVFVLSCFTVHKLKTQRTRTRTPFFVLTKCVGHINEYIMLHAAFVTKNFMNCTPPPQCFPGLYTTSSTFSWIVHHLHNIFLDCTPPPQCCPWLYTTSTMFFGCTPPPHCFPLLYTTSTAFLDCTQP